MDDTNMEGVAVPEPVTGTVESVSTVQNSPEDKVEALRRVGVFADLPEDQLQWFADNVIDRRLTPGDVLFRKGDPPDWMMIYLEGEVHLYWDDIVHDEVYILRAGDPASEVSGMLPFSRMTAFTVTGRAVTPMRVLQFRFVCFPR
jgi:CRP-like cAMP-binding protein